MIVLKGIVKSEYIMAAANSLKCNRMWGVEYLLMDSASLGGVDGSAYENVIKIFTDVWNTSGKRVFT